MKSQKAPATRLHDAYDDQSMGWYCMVCDEEMDLASQNTHLNGRRHVENAGGLGPLGNAGAAVKPVGGTGLVDGVERVDEGQDEEDESEEEGSDEGGTLGEDQRKQRVERGKEEDEREVDVTCPGKPLRTSETPEPSTKDQPRATNEDASSIEVSSALETTFEIYNPFVQHPEEIEHVGPSTKQLKIPSNTPNSTIETFTCTICGDKEFSVEKRKYHLGRAWECTICGKTMHQGWRNSHIAGSKHRARELRKLAEANRERELRELVEAHTTVPPEVISVDEVSSVTAVAQTETASTEQGRFYCEVCEREFSMKHHKYHRSPGWECTLCDLRIHSSSKHSHLTGRRHIKRVGIQG